MRRSTKEKPPPMNARLNLRRILRGSRIQDQTAFFKTGRRQSIREFLHTLLKSSCAALTAHAIHLNRGTDRMASAPDIRFRHEPNRPHRLFRCILLFFFPRPGLPARAVHRPDSKRKKNQKHHKPAHAFRSPSFPVFRPAYAVRFYVLPETWYNPVGMTNHEPFKESDHGQKKPFHQVPDPQAHRE